MLVAMDMAGAAFICGGIWEDLEYLRRLVFEQANVRSVVFIFCFSAKRRFYFFVRSGILCLCFVYE